ncbi:MAG: hypothetical protein Q9200_007833, partial [Gallowayella weberi]
MPPPASQAPVHLQSAPVRSGVPPPPVLQALIHPQPAPMRYPTNPAPIDAPPSLDQEEIAIDALRSPSPPSPDSPPGPPPDSPPGPPHGSPPRPPPGSSSSKPPPSLKVAPATPPKSTRTRREVKAPKKWEPPSPKKP